LERFSLSLFALLYATNNGLRRWGQTSLRSGWTQCDRRLEKTRLLAL